MSIIFSGYKFFIAFIFISIGFFMGTFGPITAHSENCNEWTDKVSETMQNGPYNPELEEIMLSEGMCRIVNEDYLGAIRSFRHSQHISRVNYGLYTANQINALSREVKLWIKLDNIETADDRYKWLHYVQMRNLRNEEQVLAIREYVHWLRLTSYMELPGHGYQRLNYAIELILPLVDKYPALNYDLLYTLYYIKSYDASKDLNTDPMEKMQHYPKGFMEFTAIQRKIYNAGEVAMQRVLSQPSNQEDRAYALVTLGDWQIWNNHLKEAHITYMEAYNLSPDIMTPQRIPNELVMPIREGDIPVAFTVTPAGKLIDWDYPEDEFILSKNRKGWRYRPRIKDGEFVNERIETMVSERGF